MAAHHKAAEKLNKGFPSSFYSQEGQPDNANNPVFQSFEQELQRFMASVTRRSDPCFKPDPKEPSSKIPDTLFNLWNNFENRLPPLYVQRKMIEVGDFLVSMQLFSLARWQCYDRFIMKWFCHIDQVHFKDVNVFKQCYFFDSFNGEVVALALRALYGRLICSFHSIRCSDPRLVGRHTIAHCIEHLTSFQIIMQALLPKESMCWLIYNGTIHIYTISRHLMMYGYSAQVLDYLLWASTCMETSIPLLAVKYLSWRSTLYTSVCQCYYDTMKPQFAEAFARRALAKVSELSQLERMSSSTADKFTETSFRIATFKMAVMIFKRSVIETRKRPKGFLRPQNRINLKEAAQQPWPRTQTEKLLSNMFEGSSAQTLALLEALSDSNRRTLLTNPLANESDVEILDTYLELFMAAQEIFSGGGGNGGKEIKDKLCLETPGMTGIVPEQSLIDMAIQGEDGITMSAVVSFIKAAYNYQQYEFVDTWLPRALCAIQEMNDCRLNNCKQELEIIQAYDNVLTKGKGRKPAVPDPVPVEEPKKKKVPTATLR